MSSFLLRNETLHVMRDNPQHGVPVLTGTFGVRQTSLNREHLRTIRDTLLSKALKENNSGGYSTFDQTILQVRHFLTRADILKFITPL